MKTRKKLPAAVAVALVLSILMVMGSGFAAASGVSLLGSTNAGESVHEKISISDITGDIPEPPELTSAASAIATEKEWYEYVYYSSEPVAHFYLSDTARYTFYDPYDYASSLIMEVDDSITDWSSMNTLQVSYTTGDSITTTEGKSTQTSTSTLRGYTDTTTNSYGESTVTTTTDNKTYEYNTSKTKTEGSNESEGGSESESGSWNNSTTLGGETTTKLVIPAIGEEAIKASLSDTFSFGGGDSESKNWSSGTSKSTTTVEGTGKEDDQGNKSTGYSHSFDSETVTTSAHTDTITNTIADRITDATGYTSNSSITLATENSTTITKTYDAAYFNASGAPLQWKVVKYTVQMPMKIQVEYLVDDEWVFGGYSYCLLNTVQGTCRAWLQNNVAYYEHWGTGEPVTWNEFWSQFFTKENLVAAYQNKLYPDN